MERRRWIPAALGSLLFLLFFASLLDPGVQLYYRDTGRLYYPVKLYIAQHLRAGHLPLWDTMTEAGASLLGQVTPALLHPATLLYLAFPFDLAFKLNHLLGPLLGGIGAYRLARRLDASAWAALAAAIGYAGSGYLISMTGSNLPYSLGAGSVPVAIDAVVAFVSRPGSGRLAWAAAAVALIALAGDPQSVWIAGLLSAAWVAALANGWRQAARNLGLAAACGAVALSLAAPAVFPAVVQLRRSNRAGGVSENERLAFANHPVRLAGLLVPRAFDDAPEAGQDPAESRSTVTEFLDGPAFSDSIVLGAPLLALAAAALFAGIRGRLLVGAGVLFALASAGEALGIERAVFGLVPLESLFRYAEKLTAPASLCFALAAAIGTDFAFTGPRRRGVILAAGAGLLAAACAAAAVAVQAKAGSLAEMVRPVGKSHRVEFAIALWDQVRAGLFDVAGLSLALAAAASWRSVRQRETRPLAALCCAASVFASSGGLLYRCPVEYVRGPFDLARRMIDEAGPSPGRWRIFVNVRDDGPVRLRDFPGRLAASVSAAEALLPQYNSTAGIESLTNYFSVGDPAYSHAIHETPEKYFDLFGVRYAVEMPNAFSEGFARAHGFRRAGIGYWVREYPVASRAFVVGEARRVASIEDGVAEISNRGFDVRARAVIRGSGAPERIAGRASAAILERTSPESMRIRVTGPGLLVVGEHYDPGWSASAEGESLPTFEADLAAVGVPLPARPCVVTLRFSPRGFPAGLALSLLTAAALLIASKRGRRLTNFVTGGTERVTKNPSMET